MNIFMNKLSKISAVLMISGLLLSCRGGMQNRHSEAITPVWIEEVKIRNIEEYITTTATARARKTVEIRTEMNGKYRIQQNPATGQPYKLGDKIRAGEVIVRIENREYANNIQLESKKLQVAISKKEHEGQKSLLEKGGATEKDVHMAENSYINALSSLENARISIQKMQISAPFDGIIVKLPYFTDGVEIASGTIVTGIMDYAQMYMEVNFPENALSSVKNGQKVHITNYNIGTDTLSGRVTQLSPAIQEESRTFAGRIEIENPELRLRPGMFVKADVIVRHKDSVVAIPKDILLGNKDALHVFTVNRDVAGGINVVTGISDNRYVEVKKGLKQGDKIVVKGYEWLRNGSKVKIMK